MSQAASTRGAVFTRHTIESAPPASRRLMAARAEGMGYLPAGLALMAESPHLLDGFLKMTGMFGATTLGPLAREALIMTVATRNGCHLCVAMHTAALTKLSADPALISALRAGPDEPLPDPRLDAVRVFTLRALDTAGDVGDAAMRAFLGAGYTPQNALEVVLGIATYTLATLANRLTGAPVDPALAQFA